MQIQALVAAGASLDTGTCVPHNLGNATPLFINVKEVGRRSLLIWYLLLNFTQVKVKKGMLDRVEFTCFEILPSNSKMLM